MDANRSRASSDWRVGCMSESAAPSSDTAGAPGCGVRRAATRQRYARRAHAPRRATAPQGQRRGAEPRSRTARHTNRAGPSVAMVRRLGTERQAYVVPALAPYAIPQGAIPKVQSPKPRNAPTTSFFAAGSAVLAAVRFYSRPQAAGCLVGCSADVENIGSWRRAANANKVM